MTDIERPFAQNGRAPAPLDRPGRVAIDLEGVERVRTVPNLRIAADRPGEAVIGLVERMSRHIDSYDLDRIDGEFLWLWCHRDVTPIIEELRAIKASDSVPYRDDYQPDRLGFTRDAPPVEDLVGTWWPFVDEESYQTYRHYLDLRKRADEKLPVTVVDDLLVGRPVTLRPMEVSLNMKTFSDGTEAWFVLVLVPSGSVTGRDVEDAIETAVDEFDLAREGGGAFKVHRTDAEYFQITDHQPLRALKGFAAASKIRLPCVGVLAPIPLCSAGGIGREYDAVVRSEYQWHLDLPGARATRQDKEVALRTWGVGLHLGLGRKFGSAMRRVCEAGRLAEVSQARFGVDRKGLILRVPEAAPFVMQTRIQRPRPGEGLQTA